MKQKAISLVLAALILLSVFAVPAAALQDNTDERIASMSTDEKISQMLMPVFRYSADETGAKTNVTEITGNIEAALGRHGFAGVIVMGQNIPTNENTVRLIDAMQKANATTAGRTQLLITIDQEGGQVTRLGQGTVMPGSMALGAADDISLTKEVAGMIGSELRAVGVNADFAPDVDVNNNPSNPVIGVRSFSDDPQTVARHGSAFVEAMNDSGIISTLKHFPGHGDTDTDSHSGLPCINKTYDEIKETELVPFRACIDAGAQMIMTAHIQYPLIETATFRSKLTGEDIFLPATLSEKMITEILRGDMGFDGVVITDAMEMDAIAKHFDRYDAARLAIEAGIDILLMPLDPASDEDFEDLDDYISTLARMADNGDISMEKINTAVGRILALKDRNGLSKPYDGSDIEERVENAVNSVGTKENHDREWEITKKTITLVKNKDNTLPLVKPDQKTVVLVPYDDETIPMNYAVRKLTEDGKLPSGAVVEAYSYRYKTLEDMLPKTEGADNVIFLSEIYGASALQGDVAKMGDVICSSVHDRGGRFIVMSVNLPYDTARYQDADAIMIAYLAVSMTVDPEDKEKEITKYGPNMPVALYMMFSEDDAPTAKLPVNIPRLDEDYCYTDEVLYPRGYGLTYLSDPYGVFSEEYKSSPYYDRLNETLAEGQDMTTMEKTLAVAKSQEGYKSYAAEGTDTAFGRSQGYIWTGKELKLNEDNTGNTEYTRWAQCRLMDRSGSALYIDADWCAIFVSWCMYQAGYCDSERLRKYYYSYYADPRVEQDADSWITAFCLDQKNVWYTPASERKIEYYDWSTYYHTGTDPYDIPYKPGGIVFFSWDGSGQYFNHVGIVESYDPETHVLTYISGNTGGQVLTREMDLDTEEEFHGQPLLQNSGRIMAYGEYDGIKPLEEKEITTDTPVIVWDKGSDTGLRIQTDSDSKIVSVYMDGEYLGSNIESNMILNEGRLAVGRSEIVNTDTGVHRLTLVFDDGILDIDLTITEMKEITAEHTSITWDRSGESIVIRTNSESETVALRIGGGTAGTQQTDGVTLENGTVTLSGEFANTILADGENTLKLIFSDGEIEISIFVTDESKKEIIAEHTSITWDRSGESIVIRTSSESDTVVLRIGGGTAGTQQTDGVTLENGTVTLSGEFANTILADGENTLKLIFSDGEIEISIFVTDESKKEIIAEHTSITWDRSGESIVIRTSSESDTVVLRIGGGTAGTQQTDGVTLENGTVTLSGKFANTILADGENTLKLIFSDGEIEIHIFVTDESSKDEPSVPVQPDKPDVPKTGDRLPVCIMLTLAASGIIIAIVGRKRSETVNKQYKRN